MTTATHQQCRCLGESVSCASRRGFLFLIDRERRQTADEITAMSEPLVVIGNGMAAARFAEELSRRALGRYAVALIGDEPRLAYNRVLLSSLLAEETDLSDIELKPARWWRDHGVTLRYGVRATAVDPTA